MDDILGQALRSAEIVTATNQSTNQNRQIQPRPQAVRTVQNGPPTNGPSDGHGTPVARAVRTVQYRPVIRDGTPQGTPTQQVLIRQSPHPTNQNRQTNKILVVQPGNTPVRNVQTGQTLVISSSSNGQNQFQIAQADGPINGPVRTNQNSGPIRTVQPGQTILRSAPRPVQNGGTPGNVRIITGRPRPSPVRTTLIPVSSASSSTNQGTPQGSGQVRQIMVPVQTYKTTTTPGPHGSGPHNGPNGPPPRKILIQKGSPTGTPRNAPIAPPPSGAIQQPRRPMRQPQPQTTEAGRQKVSVQCHEPSGSRPGFIVLQSDYIDNLRSTYTQLQRCFSTSYKDIMDINDNEHALMPKLKDIYRKADQNYRNYLTRNPLKILDNLKTVAGRNGEYVTLESYLNSQKTQNYTVRVRPDPGGTVAQTNSPQIRNANVITVQGTPNRIRFPSSNPPNGTIKPRDSPEPKPKPQKKPTAIQLRLDADHLDQTSLLNINDPFSSIRDFQSRLLPFHCSLPPSITNQDESHAENLIMEPLCEEILTRKRQMEQDFRNKFNNWNCLQAVGEDLLMEKLAIELEMDEIREKRQKIEKKRQETIRNRPIKEQHIHEHLNNNQNTVQMPVDDIDEHDNAVKGLLDNF